MDNLNFWDNWPKSQKYIYLFLTFLFLLSVLFYLTSYFQGIDALIDWGVNTQMSKIPQIVSSFELGLYSFEVFADQFLITQNFTAGDISLNLTAIYVFLALLAFGLSVLMAVFTTLSRFWYIAGMALFIFLAIYLQTGHLLLFGTADTTSLIIIFALYLPISYYFHAFRQDISLKNRLITFIGITIILAILIHNFSGTANPWLYLAHYGIAGPVVLSIFFILVVAHEIISGFLFIITNGSTRYSKNNVYHFCILSLIYLAFVFLTYFKNTSVIDWDFYYADAFLLLLVSAIIGIWGYRKKKGQLEGIISFGPVGEYFYIALAIICFATIGYFFATANDPILETFEDIIIFSHFGFGLTFFLYILVNFFSLLYHNAEVHKVVYKPVKMPYFTANLGGLVIVGILLFRSGLFPYKQAVSGYYNALGDVYAHEKDFFLAEQYYKQGALYEFQNHRSNYSLASLAYEQNDQATALYYFEQALLKKPSDYAYVNLSNIYKDNNRIFDALFTLKKGLSSFPQSGAIQNNLSLVYSQLNIPDSAIYFLGNALEKNESENVALTNLLALQLSSSHSPNVDSILNSYQHIEYMPAQTNLLALANQENKHINNKLYQEALPDTVLTQEGFSFIYNYAFNHIENTDQNIAAMLQKYSSHPANGNYREVLDFMRALHLYYTNHVAEAFLILEQLSYESTAANGYYLNILGLFSLEQKAYTLAASYFEQGAGQGFEESRANEAFAWSATGAHGQATQIWKALQEDENPQMKELASHMLMVLANGTQEVDTLRDETLYQKLIFGKNSMEEQQEAMLLSQIQDPELKAKYYIYQFETAVSKGNLDTAEAYLNKAKETSALENKIFWAVMRLSAANKNMHHLANNMDKLLPETNQQKLNYMLFEALLHEAKGDTAKAGENYALLASLNPFFEVGILHAAQFYMEQKHDEMKAYDALLQALRFNPNSIPLQKAYILQSLQLGLEDYAATALNTLKNLTNPEEFSAFVEIYTQELEKRQAGEGWQ